MIHTHTQTDKHRVDTDCNARLTHSSGSNDQREMNPAETNQGTNQATDQATNQAMNQATDHPTNQALNEAEAASRWGQRLVREQGRLRHIRTRLGTPFENADLITRRRWAAYQAQWAVDWQPEDGSTGGALAKLS
mmetsp:Transcript_12014/g.20303  ORF Transcript_12014/g.20303 Transcript_12014/m.20303 type:complete len:135 (+) Transcript_12014:166-570(+)